jgi:flagellar motor switch protein FliG
MMEQTLLTDPQDALNVQDVSAAARAYSKSQKGAIIIALLGAEHAGPIVEALEDRHLRSFVTAMQTIKFIPRPILLATIAEFITSLRESDSGLVGGEKQARELAETLLSTDRAQRVFGNGQEVSDNDTQNIWDALEKEKSIGLAEYLNSQRPELVSCVLAKLSSVKAGEVLADLSDTMADAAARHMSSGARYGADIETAISELIKIEYLGKKDTEDGSKTASFMADVMGVLPKTRRDRLMEIIKTSNPDAADKIRKGLLTFEDLPMRLPKTAVPLIFRDMAPKELLNALKAGQDAEPKTTEFLYANISQRMATQYKEQVEELGVMSEKEADSAIIALMSFISRQAKAGTISYIDIADAVD